MNFGSEAPAAFAALTRYRPDDAPFCMEFWNGWFDHWGRPHVTRAAEDAADALAEILDAGVSINFYMAHGGTNFGTSAGANHHDHNGADEYLPPVTSHDYDAALDERGAPTAKFHAFREVLAKRGAEVSKHVANVFLKLGMPPGEDNRRVKAILTWLEHQRWTLTDHRGVREARCRDTARWVIVLKPSRSSSTFQFQERARNNIQTTAANHKGRGLGITALILAILLNIVGLILGIIALVISRLAGAKNGWAVAAIVVGAVLFVVLGGATLIGLTAINSQCGDLGPGVHQWNGLSLTCS